MKQTIEIQENKSAADGYAEINSSLNLKIWNAAKTFYALLVNGSTANRTITLPDKSFTVAGTDDVAAEALARSTEDSTLQSNIDNKNSLKDASGNNIHLSKSGNYIYWGTSSSGPWFPFA